MKKKKLTIKQLKILAEIIKLGSIMQGCKAANSSRSYFYKLLRTNPLFKEQYTEAIAGIKNTYTSHIRLLSEKSCQVLEDALKDEKVKIRVAEQILKMNLKLDELSGLHELEKLEREILAQGKVIDDQYN
jgi:molybdenum-dependent DNA-binding transcriptional regulator ModE